MQTETKPNNAYYLYDLYQVINNKRVWVGRCRGPFLAAWLAKTKRDGIWRCAKRKLVINSE